MPPTMPPAIAPVFELGCRAEVEDDDALDVTNWEALVVEVGTMEAVPVTSGESR